VHGGCVWPGLLGRLSSVHYGSVNSTSSTTDFTLYQPQSRVDARVDACQLRFARATGKPASCRIFLWNALVPVQRVREAGKVTKPHVTIEATMFSRPSSESLSIDSTRALADEASAPDAHKRRLPVQRRTRRGFLWNNVDPCRASLYQAFLYSLQHRVDIACVSVQMSVDAFASNSIHSKLHILPK